MPTKEVVKKEKPAKAEKAAKAEAPKYGIAELSTALGVEATTARIQLRNANIKKVGGRYGWETKSAMEEVITKLKAGKKKTSTKKAKAEDDDEDDE